MSSLDSFAEHRIFSKPIANFCNWLRLVKLVAELKQHKYPNCASFARKLREADINEGLNIVCTEKTIQRDIQTLKRDFNAPIEFNAKENGYYLVHHGWNFECPVLQDEFLIASVFGAKIAEDIFPEPIKSQIRSAVDTELTNNNPDFLDTAFVESLIIGSGCKVEDDRYGGIRTNG